jgi:hypothetical protein
VTIRTSQVVVVSSRRHSPASVAPPRSRASRPLCALDVDLKDGRIVDVRGVTADRVQQGELCVKADLMTELVYNPHRLRTPMKRVAGAKGSSDSRFEAQRPPV